MSWYLPYNITPALLPFMQQIDETAALFRQARDPGLADRLIRAYQQLIAQPDFPASPVIFQGNILADLGQSFLELYQLTGEPNFLEEAQNNLINGSVRIPIGRSVERARVLFNLSAVFVTRYGAFQGLDDLNLSIDYCKAAYESLPEHTNREALYLSAYISYLLARYQIAEDPQDLTNALVAAQWAQKDTVGFPHYAASIDRRLASGFMVRYNQTYALQDIETAIYYQNEAYQLVRNQAGFDLSIPNDLSYYLFQRYQDHEVTADLDQAIAILKDTYPLAQPFSMHQALVAGNLGSFLLSRYLLKNNLSDLDEAFYYAQTAFIIIDQYTPGAPYAPATVAVMARVLYSRYQAYHNPQELHDAFALFEKLNQHPAVGDSLKSLVKKNLADCLVARYKQNGQDEDAQRARALLTEAVDLAKPDSPDQVVFSLALAAFLIEYYDVKKDPAVLEEALSCFERLKDRFDPARKPYYDALGGLGDVYLRRYDAGQALADLDRSIDIYRQIITLGEQKDYPERISDYVSLGYGLIERSARTGDAEDENQGIAAYQKACLEGSEINPLAALNSSRNWGVQALRSGHARQAAQAFQAGTQVLENIFHTQLLIAGKRSFLKEHQWMYLYEAYALAQAGDPQSAVLALERGRAKMLNEALLRNRFDVEKLRAAGHEQLYEEYKAWSSFLNTLEGEQVQSPRKYQSGRTYEIPIHKMLRANHNATSESLQARKEINRLMGIIGALPEFKEFFEVLDSDEEVKTVLENAPGGSGQTSLALYLLATMFGSSALLLHPGGIELIPLKLTAEELQNRMAEVSAGRITGGYLFNQQLSGDQLKQDLDVLIPWLGEAIVSPVARRMAELLPGLGVDPVRLIMIPTGLFAQLPLHAVPFLHEGKQTCLQEVCSVAYAPSLKVLQYAQSALPPLEEAAPRLCGVGNPLEAGVMWVPLEFASFELQQIATCFDPPAAISVNAMIFEQAADRQINLGNYLHFACHAQFEPENPLESGIILSLNDRLSLSSLIGRSEQKARWRLVTLSACQTALSDFTQIPEETVGLQAGFIQAGAVGVIGSLWPVADVPTSLLMIKFYEYHRQGLPGQGSAPLAPVDALRAAQLWLREVNCGQLVELFAGYSSSPNLDAATTARLDEQFANFINSDPDTRPYAHPYYWGAFTFCGA